MRYRIVFVERVPVDVCTEDGTPCFDRRARHDHDLWHERQDRLHTKIDNMHDDLGRLFNRTGNL